jgi:lysozyme
LWYSVRTDAKEIFNALKEHKNMPLLNIVIDLSHHNTVTSFEAVRASGILGVIHKATEGSTFVDGDYEEHRAQALAAGLMWGAYHFGVRRNVQDQVDHFLNTVNPGPTDLLVLDFEPNPNEGTMRLAEAEEFVERINEQIGHFPGLYSGQAFIRDQLRNRTETVLQNCFLWIARYNTLLPQVPSAFPTFTLWQYTDGSAGPQPHRVPGIGRCDRNKFNGDEAGLKRLWGIEEA